MEREWRIWLGFCAVVFLAVVFVLVRNDDKDDPSQLAAGTSLPTTTLAPSTTVSLPTTSSSSSSSSSTTPPTAPPTTRRAASATTEGTVAPTTPPTAAPTTPPTTEPPLRVQFGPGTFRIGIDLPAGTYRTDGGQYCFWARLSSLSGTPDSVIAGENTNGGPATVTIAPTDNAFATDGCALWLTV
jgi:hypothetical protein